MAGVADRVAIVPGIQEKDSSLNYLDNFPNSPYFVAVVCFVF
jgi:hypothetical protein